MDERISAVQRRLRRRSRRWRVVAWVVLGTATGGGIGASLAGARVPTKAPARSHVTDAQRPEREPSGVRWDPARDPPETIALLGGPHALRLRLEPGHVEGSWIENGRAYTLLDAELTIVTASAAGTVRRGPSVLSSTATAQYRLRFAIDRCELERHESPWSPCSTFVPGTPPRLERREFLVDRVTTRWATGETHRVHAACVPASGAGPTCAMAGVRTMVQ